METVGTFEARNRLSELLDKVEKGEEVVITRHGRPVAKLVQVEETPEQRRERVTKLIEEIKEARKGLTLGGVSWKELRDGGRRW